MSGGVKKWFMLQVWRIQQVAQLLVLTMMAITDAILVYDYTDGLRVGGEPLISDRALGVLFVLILIGGAIWLFALIWDMRLKMWREQMTVLVEKNPFTKEKMTPKEIAMVNIIWAPLIERLGKDDPKAKEYAKALKHWARKSMKEDPIAEEEVRTILKYVGGLELDIFDEKAE
ncbi:MAG: hypothetical protein JSU93_01985 [Methanobacteriota archaeon]|nr:MAG: hypothetical protein JSU93_01985 [Euryarchaeota archaeon]